MERVILIGVAIAIGIILVGAIATLILLKQHDLDIRELKKENQRLHERIDLLKMMMDTLKIENEILKGDVNDLESLIYDGKYDFNTYLVTEETLKHLQEITVGIIVNYTYCEIYEDSEKYCEFYLTRGTGAIVGKNDSGYFIITAGHVIANGSSSYQTDICVDEECTTVETFNVTSVWNVSDMKIWRKEWVKGKTEIIYLNKSRDVALILLKTNDTLDYFKGKIANFSQIYPGNIVYISGTFAPEEIWDWYNVSQNITVTLHQGWIGSTCMPNISLSNALWQKEDMVLLSSTGGGPGYSGGAVFLIRDGKPELLGILVGGQSMPEIAVAIKVPDEIREIIFS